ncbi:hypothetical protein [Proteus hauseri]|uniref:hypothetical protein n=1 Tax=Proteus hauseri TaxID=183417 RepID=UPI0032DB20E6
MFYYIYILHGPLKGTIFPLTSDRYFISLYKNKSKNINNDKATLYIPCDDKVEEKTLSVTLDKDNIKNNTIKIENSKIKDDIEKPFLLEIDKIFYLNDIPIFLISNKNNSPLSPSHFKKFKRKFDTKKMIVGIFALIILPLIVFTLFMPHSEPKEIASTSLDSLNFKGFNGENDYYCIYDNLFPDEMKSTKTNSNIIYIDTSNINSLFNEENNNKIYNLILKDKQKPTINFIYHNEYEKTNIIKAINKVIPLNCQINSYGLSLPKIIDDINKLSFIKETSYTIQEKKNGIIFIFDDSLTSENKTIIDNYIKKQTAIFGRKFITYHENISNPDSNYQATLKEEKGYIFINNQHRYFPQGL